jgi:hypothetical protein
MALGTPACESTPATTLRDRGKTYRGAPCAGYENGSAAPRTVAGGLLVPAVLVAVVAAVHHSAQREPPSPRTERGFGDLRI